MDLTVCSKRTTAVLSAVGQSLTVNVSDSSSAIVEMTTSALSGHNVTFEVSNDAKEDASGSWDGVSGSWRMILGQRTSVPSTFESVTGALSVTPIYSWMFSVGGFKYLRIRVTAHTSGSANWLVTATDAAMTFNSAVPPSAVTLNTGTSVIGDVGGVTRSTAGGFVTALRLASSAASTNATVAKSSAFLSRLCGGEELHYTPLGYPRFLSRLCGGEVPNNLTCQISSFLSRLCGGEGNLQSFGC